MTNRQWLLEQMQNMSDEELSDFLTVSTKLCYIIEPSDDCYGKDDCSKCKLDWLKAEHKEPIKISDAERVILENIDKDYKWIAREENSRLYVYKYEPSKEMALGEWLNNESEGEGIPMFNHLFQFIKWEDTEAYNIEELLKGE